MNDPLPKGEEKAAAVRELFDTIAPRYDLVNRVISFGMDVGWRRRAVGELLLPGGSVVGDLACGTGDLCRELQRSGYAAVGFDVSAGMLRSAKTAAPLVLADVLRVPVRDGSLGGVTCGFALRNVVSLEDLFAEIARVVSPRGRVSLLDAAEPAGRVMRTGHSVCLNKIVPLIGAALSDRAAYTYLPRSMAYLPPTEELIAMMRSAGFANADRLALSGGVAQLLVGTRDG